MRSSCGNHCYLECALAFYLLCGSKGQENRLEINSTAAFSVLKIGFDYLLLQYGLLISFGVLVPRRVICLNVFQRKSSEEIWSLCMNWTVWLSIIPHYPICDFSSLLNARAVSKFVVELAISFLSSHVGHEFSLNSSKVRFWSQTSLTQYECI